MMVEGEKNVPDLRFFCEQRYILVQFYVFASSIQHVTNVLINATATFLPISISPSSHESGT